MARTVSRRTAAACVVLAFQALPAYAGPAEYLIAGYPDEGAATVAWRAGRAQRHDAGHDSEWSLGWGYGLKNWWFTEFYAAWAGASDHGLAYDEWEWANRVALTEPGRYAVDVAFTLSIERPKDRDEGWGLQWGPLLHANIGTDWDANLNLLFERRINAAQAARTDLGYQLQLKYGVRPLFDVGVQAFGSLGPWRSWASSSEQSHAIGPALFGKFKPAAGRTVRWDVALLHGLTDGSPRTTLRGALSYEY